MIDGARPPAQGTAAARATGTGARAARSTATDARRRGARVIIGGMSSPRWSAARVRGVVVAGAALVGGALGACTPVSPPPLVPMHAGTAPHAVDETTITVVVGLAGELLGGEGWGVALRGERQVDDGTAVGVQLAGGRGSEGQGLHGRPLRHWLLEVRGYGRLGSVERDWLAGLASLGVTAMDTGLLATTVAAGAAVSYPNDYTVPALGVFAAVSHPWRRGDGFGPDHDEHVDTTWWLGVTGGVQVPVGDSGNAVSLEAGVARALGVDGGGQISVSLADSHTF